MASTTHRCKHCATPYTIERSGVDGFCCAGCQQVYQLIQQEGLGDYYRLQDRVAQPLKDRELTEVDALALRRAQVEVEAGSESGRAVFEVEGMSCMGCAWLVERLANSQNGCVQATASLSQHSLTLEWRRSEFDLSVLGSELFKFGYRMRSTPSAPGSGPRISPLALRCLLTLVFTGNVALLAAYEQFAAANLGEGEALLSLLGLICLCFTLLLGAAPFFLSSYRAIQIRRWHSDWIPMTMIVTTAGIVAFHCAFSGWPLNVGCLILATLVCVLIAARWLGALISKRS
ncbi:heavy metal translocating P-type ATPase metal-binding domain-containing protein [Coraliomargarita sp. SDUM461003]|uniref:Heavy metal translocating P-type ATPase metal-binding domain-containing protein n=1 Tax=Thalassobacterium maritimum TaxID=3041265 RepID=A0ABU1AS45_9BACT|nr:heavy metal translocating P-type ATPase metal-binding domain-containing protein [Coraliomargarita sp. SDUM461003]MDQ8206983.1 heavy metal translocating P-type ATPase metal-binding domain-containing protein [Coraliomargarita sp. SDUM461003]